WWVDPINKGQISPCSPSEQSLTQRACLDNNLKLDGWSEEPSGIVFAKRDFARPARNSASGFLMKLTHHGN
ncbi:hypothetical protein A2U01_0043933, partial [Trifolium medium]|nr:hypothetical protein [Trifolium medium]